MALITSESDLVALFTIPFKPKKILYSLNSDFFMNTNASCKVGEKQLAIDIDDEELLHNPLPEFHCGEHGCRSMFTTVHDYEIHYRSAHSITCSECKRSFPSYSLLDLHIQERHDTYFDTAKDKKFSVFNCLVDSCQLKFSSFEERNEHAIKVHNYPPNFKFQNLKLHKAVEKMDVTSPEETNSMTTKKSHKSLPKNICFGRGSSRAFVRKNKCKDISMKELGDAL